MQFLQIIILQHPLSGLLGFLFSVSFSAEDNVLSGLLIFEASFQLTFQQ